MPPSTVVVTDAATTPSHDGRTGPTFDVFFPAPRDAASTDAPSACTPLSCTNAGGQYCGLIGDGCGGSINCDSPCPAGTVCGGSGTPRVCGALPDPNCVPLSCDQGAYKLCGRVGNGCGGVLECGSCAAGTVCGGAGVAGICAAPPDPNCKPLTCDQPGGKLCGRIGNGCGGVLDCPTACDAPQTCGGGGRPGLCGYPAGTCTPQSCQAGAWKYCGTVGDGCGSTQDCGGCTAPSACGGDIRAPQACSLPTCTGLCQRQVACAANLTTSLSGTVVAPTLPEFGVADPIYNALVYVPNAPLTAFGNGATCSTCDSLVSGSPLVAVTTGFDGKFKLDNVPAGDSIPLVVQLGKWRRQVVIPKVEACKDNPIGTELTRLPRNKTEGDIPQFALATGKVDAMECVLHKMGIDKSEFTPPTGNGRIHVYQQNGVVQKNGNTKLTPNESELWGSLATMQKYDIVVLPCRGGPSAPANANTKTIIDYANGGGRLFATHYSYTWLTWMLKKAQDGFPIGSLPIWEGDLDTRPNNADRAEGFPSLIDQSTNKGKSFYAWLENVGALNGATEGDIDIHSFRSDLASIDAPASRLIYTEANKPTKTVQQFDLGMPSAAAPANQCGRVAFSDFHVAGNDNLTDKLLFSTDDCDTMPLRPQEKVLEFLLFDIASCVNPASPPPPPPPPPAAPPASPPPAPPAPPPAAPPLPPPPAPPPPE